MSNNTEFLDDEILSADDLLAVADFDWRVTSILGKKTRQRPLDLTELFIGYREFPEIEKLVEFPEDDPDKSEEEKNRAFFENIADKAMGLGREAAAYIVATSLGKGSDAKYRAVMLSKPEDFLIQGLSNALTITFGDGGIHGFFTRKFGDLMQAATEAGLTPTAIAKMSMLVEAFAKTEQEAAEA